MRLLFITNQSKMIRKYIYSEVTIKEELNCLPLVSMSMVTFTIFMTIVSFRTRKSKNNLGEMMTIYSIYREFDRDRDLEKKKKIHFMQKEKALTHRR